MFIFTRLQVIHSIVFNTLKLPNNKLNNIFLSNFIWFQLGCYFKSNLSNPKLQCHEKNMYFSNQHQAAWNRLRNQKRIHLFKPYLPGTFCRFAIHITGVGNSNWEKPWKKIVSCTLKHSIAYDKLPPIIMRVGAFSGNKNDRRDFELSKGAGIYIMNYGYKNISC